MSLEMAIHFAFCSLNSCLTNTKQTQTAAAYDDDANAAIDQFQTLKLLESKLSLPLINLIVQLDRRRRRSKLI